MSFWSKAGDWFKNTGGSIGGAISNAYNTVYDVPADFGGFLLDHTAKPVAESLAAPMNFVSQELSTVMQVARNGGWLDQQKIADANKRAKGYTSTEGKQIDAISPGQLEQMSWNSTLGVGKQKYDVSEAGADKRNNYFQHTWEGKLASGSMDLGLNLVADPLNGVGKGLTALRKANVILKPGEATDVLDAARGGEAASRSIAKKAEHVNNFVTWTVGKSAAAIARHPAVSESPEKGTLASLLSESKSVEESRALIGASLGDEASKQVLRDVNSILYEQLDGLTKPPGATKAVVDFKWNNYGQGMLDFSNQQLDANLAKYHTAIQDQMARFDSLISAEGTTNRVATDWGGRLPVQTDDLKVTEIRHGLGGRVITVVKGGLALRLEGHINIASASEGYDQLDNLLKQAPHITGAQREAFLGQFSKAATQGERRNIVVAAEGAVVRSTGEEYGLSAEQIQRIMNLSSGRRRVYRDMLKGRLYSAAPDSKYVAYADPEYETIIARDKPGLHSQIEDFHPIIDPRDFDAAMRAGARERLFDKMMRYGYGLAPGQSDAMLGQAAADKLYGALDPMAELTGQALMAFTRGWKDLMLIPRAIAYIPRTQIDSQLRLLTHIGAANYLAGAGYLTASVVKGVVKRDLKSTLPDFFRRTGMNDEEIAQTIRILDAKAGSHSDLVGEVANIANQNLMAKGGFGRVRIDDPNHEAAYLRVINRQVRNSATAMKVVEGMSPEELRKWVFASPEGRREWLEMSAIWDNDVDHWLGRVRTDVNYYLPNSELRAKAAKRELDTDDYGVAFGKHSLTNKMDVHGQAYLATDTESAWAKFRAGYHEGRKAIYQVISDTPESVMSRSPLYVYEYNSSLRRILANQGADIGTKNITGKASMKKLTEAEANLVTPEQLQGARVQADRIARKNVSKLLFDSSHTSNAAHYFRYASPFFGAWEDVMRKWSALFYDNPQALERVRQAWGAPNQMGIVADEYGNTVDSDGRHINPKTHEDVSGTILSGKREMMGLHIPWKSVRDKTGVENLQFDKRGLNIVFQGEPAWLPGSGPLASIPMNEFIKRVWPEGATNPIVNYFLPYGTSDQSVTDQAIPAWARAAHNALGTTDDYKEIGSRLILNAQIQYQEDLAAWEEGGQVGPKPKEPSLEEIANRTRNWFLIKAATGLTSPIAAANQADLQFYKDQANIYRQKFGDPQNTPEYKQLLTDYVAQTRSRLGAKATDAMVQNTAKAQLLVDRPEFTDWTTRFYQDFPDYFELTISTSEGAAGLNMNLATVTAAKQFSKQIRALGPGNEEFGWAIAGPDTAYGLDPAHAFNDASRDWMIANGYRKSILPAEALQKAEAAKGWKDYQQVRTRLNLQLAERGLHSVTQKGAEDLHAAFTKFVKSLKEENLDWQAEYDTRQSGRYLQFLREMDKAMDSSPKLAARGDMKALRDYIDVRADMRQKLQERGMASIDSEGGDDLKAAWGRFTLALVAESPGFEQIFNRYLDDDKLAEGFDDGR